MKLWINWISAMLLGLTPLLLHLLIKKPRSQSLPYDLAGLLADPPSSEPETPKKSFAKNHSIDEVELPVDSIRQCLKESRDLSRPHAVQSAKSFALDQAERDATEMSAEKLLESLSSPIILEKETCSEEPHEIQKNLANQEPNIVIRQSRAKIVQQSATNHDGNRRRNNVRNLDTVLDIQTSRRPRG